jgi:hypothetical protein
MAFYTTVTGQVLDPSGFAYANGSFSLTLVLPTGIGAYPTFIGGGPIPGVIAGGALDASGNLPTLSVPDNNDINPPGTKWQFNILNSSGLIGFTAQVTITGTSQSVTAALQAVSASLTTAAISPTTITFPSGVTIASTGTDTWDGITVLKTTSAAPGVGALGTTLVVQNNKTSSSANVCAITAVEGVARARADGDETTLRGGHFRTYIDDTLNGTAITSVGVDASPRASGAVLADAGTAFVGVRAYMAPGFTAGTLANVTNCHAFWAYNEHATNAITNVLYASDGGGSFTNGINFGGLSASLTAEIIFSNAMTLAKKGTDTFDGLTLTKTTSAAPSVGADGVALFVQNNKTSGSANVCAITAVEGAARSRAAGAETTIRGGHFRTYIDHTLSGTAITSVGVDASPRASGSVAPDPGTAFVGVRAYMAPGFTAMTNVTNCHAFWAYNEHATNAITNVLYNSDGGGGFTNGINLSGGIIGTNEIIFSNAMTLAKAGANAWDGLTLTKSTTVGPTAGNESVALKVENNRTAVIDDQAVLTAFEAVARARGKGTELTIRGANIRTYIDETFTDARAITSVGVDASVRASGAVVPDPGTAFIGVRAYMAPGFTAMTNVTNCHAFWAFNEHATNAITNAFYVSDEGGGGGFTYGINLYGTAGTSIKTADIKLSNGQLVTVSGGSVCLNDSAQTTAGGVNKLSITLESLTNALTGSQVAFNGRSNNKVAAMTGACEGAHLLAANYEDSPSGTLRGLYTGILLKGKDINVARGFEVIVDSDDTEVIGTELAGGYIVVQTGSTQTFSGIATGLHVRHSATAGGGGKNLKSMIMLDSESNERGAAIIIDAADLKQTPGTAGNASYVCLFAAKDSDGTLRYVRLKNDGTLDTTTTWP